MVAPLAAALCSALVLAATALAAAGGVLIADRRADAAADLAALSGAVAATRFLEPCDAAGATARANGAALTRCVTHGMTIEVSVRRDVRLPWGQSLDVTAQARAGPAS